MYNFSPGQTDSQVVASHHKVTKAQESPGQMELQVDSSFQDVTIYMCRVEHSLHRPAMMLRKAKHNQE